MSQSSLHTRDSGYMQARKELVLRGSEIVDPAAARPSASASEMPPAPTRIVVRFFNPLQRDQVSDFEDASRRNPETLLIDGLQLILIAARVRVNDTESGTIVSDEEKNAMDGLETLLDQSRPEHNVATNGVSTVLVRIYLRLLEKSGRLYDILTSQQTFIHVLKSDDNSTLKPTNLHLDEAWLEYTVLLDEFYKFRRLYKRGEELKLVPDISSPSEGDDSEPSEVDLDEAQSMAELADASNQIKAAHNVIRTIEKQYPSDHPTLVVSQQALPPRTELADIPKPPFLPSQIQLAQRIIDTVQASYTKNEWSQLTSVDFRVFVPPFKQLELQTRQRAQTCGLLSSEADPDSESEQLQSRILPYSITQMRKDQMKELKRQAQEDKNTLIVLIADECEWGAGNEYNKRGAKKVKDSNQDALDGRIEEANGSANSFLVNATQWSDPDADNYASNVVVLLVSATPDALLTAWSRVPLYKDGTDIVTGYRVLEPMSINDGSAGSVQNIPRQGSVLSLNNECEKKIIQLAQAQDRSKLQPLPHVIEWFEPKTIVDGTLIILKSYVRQLIISSADRLLRVGKAPLDEIKKLPDIVVDRETSFEEDQFVLHIESSRTFGNVRVHAVQLELPGSGSQPSRWLTMGDEWEPLGSDTHREVLLAEQKPSSSLQMFEYEGGNFVQFMASELDQSSVVRREYHLATIVDKPTGKSSAVFVDRSSFGNVFAKLSSKSSKFMDALGKFGPVAEFFDLRTGSTGSKFERSEYEFSFYFGALYHGYRSLDSYISTMDLPESDGSTSKRLIRTDMTWAVQHSTSLLARWLMRNSDKDKMKLDLKCSPNCAHRKQAQLIGKSKKQSKDSCITDAHLLLAEYVYFILHYAASQDRGRPIKESLGQFISQFEKEMQDSLALCPLQFVADYYKDEDINWSSSKMKETQKIVSMLLDPLKLQHEQVRGKMVVFRVDTNLLGYCFQQGLLKALTIGKLPDFCVIPDFGPTTLRQLDPRYLHRLQLGATHCVSCPCTLPMTKERLADGFACPDCKHTHRPVNVYEDLLHLPCFVILNEKGRMGDTFPHSFACMDLRNLIVLWKTLRVQHCD